MAETEKQPEFADQAKPLSWSQVWQVPVLLLGVVVLGVGIFLAMPREEAPQYEAMLDDVKAYVKAGNLDEIHSRLEKLRLANINDPMVVDDDDLRARYHQYVGDYHYLDYKRLYELPVQTPQSRDLLEKVIGSYGEARSLGLANWGKESMARWADSLVLLGRDRDALALVNEMNAQSTNDRYAVLRELVGREHEKPESDPEALQRLLSRFDDEVRADTDRKRKLTQRQWAANVRATLYLEVGDPQRAIDYITREMQRLRAAGADDSPKLLVLLAQAYQQIADFEQARRLYAVAQQRLERGDPVNGPILVGLGQIELADGGEGFEDRAHVLFTKAAKEHPMGESYIDALIGRAHVEAMRQQVTDSLEHFRLAIAQLLESSPPWDPRRQEVTDKITQHVAHAIDVARYDDALDYLTALLPLHEKADEELPHKLLLQFAQIHEKIAEQRMARAEALDPMKWTGQGEPSASARRQAFQESAIHYADSAKFYRRHADTVTVIDTVAHGKSLWAAGQNYDHAQRWADAIDVYAEFVGTRPDDGDRLKARYHLAQAYMADRQHGPAIDLFNELIDDNPQSNWAYKSLVPLARGYTATDQTDSAVRTLLSIVDGHPGITPDSETYRDALVDLSRTYYMLGQDDPVYFVSAIERLNTAVERYGNTPDGPQLRYMLADSLRRSSSALTAEADQARSQRQRLAFQAERDRRLREAEMFYDQVITELEQRFEQARTKLDNLYLRNAYFYKADCAFDRKAFEVAIDRYREAAQRYSTHPASLVAQVQIVNAYCELGQFQQAYVANQNALWQLAQMPDDVFDRPDMPMTRTHWEHWLRWSSELKLLDKASASVDR